MQEKMNITEIEKRLEELRFEKEKLLQAASEINGAYLSSYEIRPAGRPCSYNWRRSYSRSICCDC